ncbi:GNAT family N-acetyltransferase [Bacillus sp. JJ722]
MNLNGEFLSLHHEDSIHEFKCSDEPSVEAFLKEQAMDLMDRCFSRTRLFFDSNQNLIGFYSLFNDSFKVPKKKTGELSIKLPTAVSYVPAVRLHYIGVDERYRGKGNGQFLLTSALYEVYKISKHSACTLVTIEATENAKEFYKKFGFVHLSKQGRLNLMALNVTIFAEMFGLHTMDDIFV